MQLAMNIEPGLLERAVIAICPDVWAIVKRKQRSRRMPEQVLWEELVCCILSSQVPYEIARATTRSLKRAGLLSLEEPISNFEQHVRRVLYAPITVYGRNVRYRFPNIRASQIANAKKEVFKAHKTMSNLVYGSESAEALRQQLANQVPGMGLKQASMFLRNVGISYDLAILDTHVFKYMYALNIVESFSDRVAREPYYLRAELKLKRYASVIGYPVGCLDWAIWVVMRVAAREGYA